MKILLLLIGACFRTGNQGSKIIGQDSSFQEQMKACETHIKFINFIEEKYKVNFSVYIGSYNTKFNDKLFNFYNKYLVGKSMFSSFIGL